MYGIGFGHMMGWGGGIFMMFFWVLIIIGIIYLFSNRNTNHRDNSFSYRRESQAEEIAKERYARGEITKEELEEILRDLRR